MDNAPEAENNSFASKLGLICHGERLATVFDQASEIRLWEKKDNQIYPAGHLSLPYRDLMGKISFIKSCGVDILICGAISGYARSMLKQKKIRLIPWIAGEVDCVISAYENQRLHELHMPGCRIDTPLRRCRQRRRKSEKRNTWRNG